MLNEIQKTGFRF